jgi:hypothetical protein
MLLNSGFFLNRLIVPGSFDRQGDLLRLLRHSDAPRAPTDCERQAIVSKIVAHKRQWRTWRGLASCVRYGVQLRTWPGIRARLPHCLHMHTAVFALQRVEWCRGLGVRRQQRLSLRFKQITTAPALGRSSSVSDGGC